MKFFDYIINPLVGSGAAERAAMDLKGNAETAIASGTVDPTHAMIAAAAALAVGALIYIYRHRGESRGNEGRN